MMEGNAAGAAARYAEIKIREAVTPLQERIAALETRLMALEARQPAEEGRRGRGLLATITAPFAGAPKTQEG